MMSSSYSITPTRGGNKQTKSLRYLFLGICIGCVVGHYFTLLASLNKSLLDKVDPNAKIDLSDPKTELQRQSFEQIESAPLAWHEQYPAKTVNNGWTMIHVFNGNTDKHLQLLTPMAQARQDEVVAGLLKNKLNGYFVDLAAHDATYLSNTFNLEKKHHWTGLCIEANPEYWSRLAQRQCHVVAAVIGQTTMEEITFRLHQDGALGGIEHAKFDNKPKDGGKGKTSQMYTVTLRDVLVRMQAPAVMDYLSLDVEGAEFFIMETFPFSEYRFHIMTVERPSAKLQKLFVSNGYEKLCTISNFGETLWVHTKSKVDLDLSVLNQLERPCRT